jgi:6-phospho-beta-glucosidase
MARIKMAYIGGGSTRGAGTMASFIHQGENFEGSEVVLIDLDPERLDLIRRLSERMAKARGLDLTIDATTDRRAGLSDCDAILSSYRPGGFAARVLDERIPLEHGIIGQETQGPGGFFMALRAIHAMQGILSDVEDVCPKARIFNYTNPVNVLAQAVTAHSDVPFVSLCEGPIYFADQIARACGLERDHLETVMVGLNHACWSVVHEYKGMDAMPLVSEAWERRKDDPELTGGLRRQLRIAAEMDAIPADYFQYYYCQDEVLSELQAKPTTRAEDILGWSGGYWEHYAEQAERDDPQLDPEFSRGGIHELELAIDAMDAVFNKKDEVLTVNVPNAGGALPGFDETLVVELLGRCGGPDGWIQPLPAPAPLPAHLRGLVHELGEYQALAADAGWSGTRLDAIRALAAHPLMVDLDRTERVYDELAIAHREHLPERLLPV